MNGIQKVVQTAGLTLLLILFHGKSAQSLEPLPREFEDIHLLMTQNEVARSHQGDLVWTIIDRQFAAKNREEREKSLESKRKNSNKNKNFRSAIRSKLS